MWRITSSTVHSAGSPPDDVDDTRGLISCVVGSVFDVAFTVVLLHIGPCDKSDDFTFDEWTGGTLCAATILLFTMAVVGVVEGEGTTKVREDITEEALVDVDCRSVAANFPEQI